MSILNYLLRLGHEDLKHTILQLLLVSLDLVKMLLTTVDLSFLIYKWTFLRLKQ